MILLATGDIHQPKVVVFLRALHQFQIEPVLRIRLSLHVDRVVGEQVLQRPQTIGNSIFDRAAVHPSERALLQNLLGLSEPLFAVISLNICDEPGHQLVHRDRYVARLLLASHLVPEVLEVPLEGCNTKLL